MREDPSASPEPRNADPQITPEMALRNGPTIPLDRRWLVLSSVLTSRVIYTDRKSTRLNSSHLVISYAVFCLKKKKTVSNTIENATAASISSESSVGLTVGYNSG